MLCVPDACYEAYGPAAAPLKRPRFGGRANAGTLLRERFREGTAVVQDVRTAGLVLDAADPTTAAIVVLTDVYGIQTEETQRVALQIAARSRCSVYVPDLFKGRPWDPQGVPAGSPEYEAWRVDFPESWTTAVALAWTRLAKEDGAKAVALLGFCFGGGRLVDALAAAAPPSQPEDPSAICAGAAYYGTRINADSLEQVTAPVALLFGGADGLVPPTAISRLQEVLERKKAGGLACLLEVYEGQGHAFVHRGSDSEGEVAERALDTGLHFLTTQLGPGTSSGTES